MRFENKLDSACLTRFGALLTHPLVHPLIFLKIRREKIVSATLRESLLI